ncbi:MAG: potassium channel family protein [Candidatus Omnitrophota bacterium]|nr:potassium channel family protein [Candidatus Omnitrophota bacterium]
MHKKIIFQIERLTEKAGSVIDFFGERLKNLFFGQLGVRLTYRRGAVIILLITAAALIFFAPLKWVVWSGILLMVAGMFLWLIIIFSWTLDPMIDYKIRIQKIKRWGKKLLKYLSGEFKDLEARHHMEAYAWGKLAYFEELKSEVASFSKANLLQKFLGRFFSTFMILILGYAFIFFGLQKISAESFVSAAQQNGLATFGSISDFIYYSAITIATVGYGDIYPIHAFARVFVIAEVLCGALLVIFLVSSFTAISISLTAERQEALIGEIEKEIRSIDKVFSELKHLQKEDK